MKNLKYLAVVFITFLFIYYPPIFFINILHLLAVLSWSYILINNRCRKKLFVESRYLREVIFFSFVLFYLYLMLLFNGSGDLLIGYNMLVILLEVIPTSHVIVYLFHHNVRKVNFYDLLIHVGVFQGLLAVIAFAIPQFQSLVINRMLSYGFNDIIIRMSNHRMYGFSYTFAYSMPIVQSVIACLSIYLAINKKATYILYTPILIFSGIVNARISLVILIIGVVFILTDALLRSVKVKSKVIVVIVIALLLFNPFMNYIEKVSPMTYEWLLKGANEIGSLIRGNPQGAYTSYVTSSNIYKLPEGLHVLFGTLNRVTRGNNKLQSDVGYINDIWFGGIVYMLIIYSYVIFKILYIKNIFKLYYNNGVLISLFLLAVLSVSNIKGIIFSLNEFINLFYLIYIYSLSLKVMKKQEIKEV